MYAFASAPTASAQVDDVFDVLRHVFAEAQGLSRRFGARVPALDGNVGALFALQHLARAGRRGLSQVEVARQLGLSASSATRLVDSLEAEGLVRRESHPTDRRINQIVLAEAGRTLLAQVSDELAGAAPTMTIGELTEFRARLSGICGLMR